jgi:tetratricopeptide (TPR) repeat protein
MASGAWGFKMTTRKVTGSERENLRLQRTRRGWSENEAAFRIYQLGADHGVPEDQLGVDGRAVGRWELCKTLPNQVYTALLSLLYNLPPEQLDLPPLVLPVASSAPTEGGSTPATLPINQLDLSVVAEDPYTVLRRQFLYQLFTFAGATMVSPSQLVATPSTANSVDIDEFIHECQASISGCWRVLQGADLVLVAPVLVTWLPTLDTMLRRSERTNELARLATEGYILAGLITVLQGHHDRAEWCCHQAVEYADASNDRNLQAAALKHLATKYRDAHYPILTLRTYERAIPLLDEVTPLLRSRIYLGLALAHADCGNNGDAVRYWDLAQETFPHDPQHDPAFQFADCRRSSLHHYGGLIHLALGRPNEAWDAFAETTGRPLEGDVPERTVIEITNCQAMAAIAQRDLDLAAATLESAALGAARLQSPMRYRESAAIYQTIARQWPNDRRVRRLAPLFEPAAIESGRVRKSDESSGQ